MTGLSKTKAWMFIVGEMAGMGGLFFANKFFDVWLCVAMLAFVTAVAIYSGQRLAKTWTYMLENRELYPAIASGHCTEPYPTMLQAAFGKAGFIISRITVNCTLICVAIIFIILASQNLGQLIRGFPGFEHADWACKCYFMPALVICLTPLIWLPSPQESWIVALVASASTVLAFFLIAVQSVIDGKLWSTNSTMPAVIFTDNEKIPEFNELISVFCIFVFGYGGMSIFPSIQMEMKYPDQFNKVVLYSMASLFVLYCLVAIPGYLNYAPNVQVNIISNLDPTSWVARGANLLITSHLIFAIVILMNPPITALEGVLLAAEEQENETDDHSEKSTDKSREPFLQSAVAKASKEQHTPSNKFRVKSIILRTVVMLAMLAFCFTLPNSAMLIGGLMGSTTVMFDTFIAPSLIHLVVVNGVSFVRPSSITNQLTQWFLVDFLISMVVVGIGIFALVSGTMDNVQKIIDGGDTAGLSCWTDGACAIMRNSSSSSSGH